MQCQSTYRGEPCLNEAKYVIEGSIIKRHACCPTCKEAWLFAKSEDETIVFYPVDENGDLVIKEE